MITLDMATISGSSWNCLASPDYDPAVDGPMTEDDIVCGASFGEGPAENEALPVGMALWPDGSVGSARGYDGYYRLTTQTASPPAR